MNTNEVVDDYTHINEVVDDDMHINNLIKYVC